MNLSGSSFVSSLTTKKEFVGHGVIAVSLGLAKNITIMFAVVIYSSKKTFVYITEQRGIVMLAFRMWSVEIFLYSSLCMCDPVSEGRKYEVNVISSRSSGLKSC